MKKRFQWLCILVMLAMAIGASSLTVEAVKLDMNEPAGSETVIQAAVEEAISYMDSDMTDYQKALVAHDWLARRCEYDIENYNANTMPQTDFQAYGALVTGKAVCEGYAKAYKKIMDALGIECIIVANNTHGWNMVKIDGKYYHVDVTSDDPVYDSIGRVRHTHFLVSDAQLEALNKSDGMHGKWTVINTNEAAPAASDGSYQAALWNQSSTSLYCAGGSWYYVDTGNRRLCKTTDLLSGSPQTIFEMSAWTMADGRFFKDASSQLWLYDGWLIFNDAKKIYCLSPGAAAAQELYKPSETVSAGQNIYGLKADNGKLYYAVQDTPNLTGIQTPYIHSVDMPELPSAADDDDKETPAQPAPLTLTGAYGERLSTVALPVGYTWVTPGKLMSSEGKQTYNARYCPDTARYKTITVQVTVQVSRIGGEDPETCIHQWDLGAVKTKATCEKEGVMLYTCSICHTTRESTIAKTAHAWDYGKVTTEATCGEKGVKTYTCRWCRSTKTEPIAKKTSHTWPTTGTVDKAPTATAKGRFTSTCSVCGEKKTENLILVKTGNYSAGMTKANVYASMWEHTKNVIGMLNKGTELIAFEAKSTAIWTKVLYRNEIRYMLPKYLIPVTKADDAKSDVGTDSGDDTTQGGAPKVGEKVKSGKATYKVTKAGEVEFTKTASVSASITIPATIKRNGKTYKVTSVAAGMMKRNTKVKKVTIGKNVTKIGKEAFYGCKNLKTITIKSSRLKSVGKNAIKGIYKKGVIVCPKAKKSAYKKLFKSSTGYKKTMKIK